MKRLLPIFSIRRAFTLIELLVVMGIIIILIAISGPALKALAKSDGTASAANQIRAYLSNARALAISQHTQMGVVFFEQSPTNAPTGHFNQTAMQIFYADPDQTKYGTVPAPNTVFIPYSNDIQYLPNGLEVATLAQDSTGALAFASGRNAAVATQMRAIIFSSDGQLVLRDGVATSTSGNPALQDWNFGVPGTAPTTGTGNDPTSTGAILIYNNADLRAENFTSDTDRLNWLQKNAAIVVVNAYTGGIIR